MSTFGTGCVHGDERIRSGFSFAEPKKFGYMTKDPLP